jgi:hypothetical protein
MTNKVVESQTLETQEWAGPILTLLVVLGLVLAGFLFIAEKKFENVSLLITPSQLSSLQEPSRTPNEKNIVGTAPTTQPEPETLALVRPEARAARAEALSNNKSVKRPVQNRPNEFSIKGQ